MTVSLTRFRAATIVPAFFDLLSALPNLHTLQFVHVHSQMSGVIRTATERKTFPSIRTIVLPTCAHHVLQCTPNIEDITCNEYDGGLLTSSIRDGACRNIKRLAGIKLTNVTLKREPEGCKPVMPLLTLSSLGILNTVTKLHTVFIEVTTTSLVRLHPVS